LLPESFEIVAELAAHVVGDKNAVPGYDLSVADPGRVVAERYGCPRAAKW
jgi:hypothetical protein